VLGDTPVDSRVLNHFRNVHRISELTHDYGPRIQVFVEPFAAHSRQEYLGAALAAARMVARPTAIFLDPDTGLAEKPSSSKYVTPGEVAALWSALQVGDCLVLYQHAARETGWLEARRKSFAHAVGGASRKRGQAGLAQSDALEIHTLRTEK